MVAVERLLRLDVRCPNQDCRATPRLRIPESQRDLVGAQSAEVVVLTYQCHVRRCQETYPITVAAFRGAA